MNVLKTMFQKVVLLACIFNLISNSLCSQPLGKDETGGSDLAADAILNKMSKKYESYKTMRAVFTLTINAPEDDVNEEQSSMIYLKGNKYHLELEGTNIICDNTTRWIHTDDPCEIQINYYEPDENPMENPAKIFSIYESDYLYRLVETVTKGGKKIEIIELTPFDKESVSFSKIRLEIDQTGSNILSAKTFSKNGVRYTLSIEKFTPNLELSDSFFALNPKEHPGCEIVDLR